MCGSASFTSIHPDCPSGAADFRESGAPSSCTEVVVHRGVDTCHSFVVAPFCYVVALEVLEQPGLAPPTCLQKESTAKVVFACRSVDVGTQTAPGSSHCLNSGPIQVCRLDTSEIGSQGRRAAAATVHLLSTSEFQPLL